MRLTNALLLLFALACAQLSTTQVTQLTKVTEAGLKSQTLTDLGMAVLALESLGLLSDQHRITGCSSLQEMRLPDSLTVQELYFGLEAWRAMDCTAQPRMSEKANHLQRNLQRLLQPNSQKPLDSEQLHYYLHLALLCGKVTLGPQLKPKANCAKQIFTVLENSAPRLYQSLRERDGDLIDRFRWAEILAHLQQNGRASHMADKMEASVFSTLREHAFATHRMSLKQNALYLMAYLRYAEYSAGGGIGFSLRESQRYFLEAEVRTLDDAYYCVSALAGKAPWLTVKVTKSHILLEQLSLTGVILPFHRTLQVRMNDTSVPFTAVSDSQLSVARKNLEGSGGFTSIQVVIKNQREYFQPSKVVNLPFQDQVWFAAHSVSWDGQKGHSGSSQLRGVVKERQSDLVLQLVASDIRLALFSHNKDHLYAIESYLISDDEQIVIQVGDYQGGKHMITLRGFMICAR